MIRATGQLGSPLGGIVFMAMGERSRTRGDPRAAQGWYDSAVEVLGKGSRTTWLANAHLLQAASLHTLGDVPGQLQNLDAADAVLDRLPDPGGLPARSQRLRQAVELGGRRTTEFGQELSAREVAVLQMAGSGFTQQEIGDQLFISYNTVKSHLRSAYRKLGASSSKEALIRLDELSAAQP